MCVRQSTQAAASHAFMVAGVAVGSRCQVLSCGCLLQISRYNAAPSTTQPHLHLLRRTDHWSDWSSLMLRQRQNPTTNVLTDSQRSSSMRAHCRCASLSGSHCLLLLVRQQLVVRCHDRGRHNSIHPVDSQRHPGVGQRHQPRAVQPAGRQLDARHSRRRRRSCHTRLRRPRPGHAETCA